MAEEIDVENGRNSNFEGLVTLTLTFDPAVPHTVVHHSSTCTYVPTFIQIEETFCGRTDVRTGGRTFFPSILLGRLSEVDLIILPTTNTRFIYVMFLSTVDDDDELLISALRDAETLHLPDDSDQVLIEAAPLNAGLSMYCFPHTWLTV